MSNQPNEPVQNYEIVNPTLETQVRTLLPSVSGYGGLLRSTNTVIPVVDVTTAAEGALLPESLQQALAFGSQTSYLFTSGTQVIANTPGFWRIYGQLSYSTNGTTAGQGQIQLSDGLSVKNIWNVQGFGLATNIDIEAAAELDVIVYLGSGESVQAVLSASGQNVMCVTARQLATSDGTLVDPSGFPV